MRQPPENVPFASSVSGGMVPPERSVPRKQTPAGEVTLRSAAQTIGVMCIVVGAILPWVASSHTAWIAMILTDAIGGIFLLTFSFTAMLQGRLVGGILHLIIGSSLGAAVSMLSWFARGRGY